MKNYDSFSGNLFRMYVADVNSNQPRLLTRKEERLYIRRSQEGDSEAFDWMVLCNLRLVWGIAGGFIGQGVPFLDLVQEGSKGLMIAIRKFDLKRSNKFSTYAVWWISQAIKLATANQTGYIRLPVHTRGIISRLNRISRILSDELDREPTDGEIADELGKPVEFVTKHLAFVRRSFVSLNASVDSSDVEGDSFGERIADQTVEDPGAKTERRILSEQISQALNTLSARQRKVLELRFGLRNGEEKTLEEVGELLGFTRERIRQIEARALRILRHPSRRRLISGDTMHAVR